MDRLSNKFILLFLLPFNTYSAKGQLEMCRPGTPQYEKLCEKAIQVREAGVRGLARRGAIQELKDLTNQGIDILQGNEALLAAHKAGQTNTVNELLSLMSPEHKKLAVVQSIDHATPGLLFYIIDSNVDLDFRVRSESPLSYAARKGSPKSLDMLLEAGARESQSGSKSLVSAASNDQADNFIYLWNQKGVDKSEKTLKAIADLAKLGTHDQFFLELFAECCDEGDKTSLDMVSKLLEIGINPNIMVDGNSVLHNAAGNANSEMLDLLFKYGAKDPSARPAICVAAYYDNPDTFENLYRKTVAKYEENRPQTFENILNHAINNAIRKKSYKVLKTIKENEYIYNNLLWDIREKVDKALEELPKNIEQKQ